MGALVLGVSIVVAAIWGLWRWAARLLRGRSEWRRSITIVLLVVTLGAGIPLLVAVAGVVAVLAAGSNASAPSASTFVAEAIARGLDRVIIAAVVTAAGAAVFGVLEIKRRR